MHMYVKPEHNSKLNVTNTSVTVKKDETVCIPERLPAYYKIAVLAALLTVIRTAGAKRK